MAAFERVSPALVALVAGLGCAGAQADTSHGAWGRLGALRSGLGQMSQGLTVSLAQGLRYDTNIVRTQNDAETLALYGRSDAGDWVSQSGVNVEYNLRNRRSTLTFGGDVGYARYFKFDEFSGWVASGSGGWTWDFTKRCTSHVDARVERRLTNFTDISSGQSTFQTTLSSGVDVGCFILERLRVNGGVFGVWVRNDDAVFRPNDLRMTGYDGSLAVVTRKKNEIGVHYRSSVTTRPNAPLVEDFKDQRYDAYGAFQISERFRLFASVGVDRIERETEASSHRSGSAVALDWTPTNRVSARFTFDRGIEDAPDLLGTTRQVDRVGLNVGWKLGDRLSAGGSAVFENDTLDAGVGQPLTGVKERSRAAGVYLRHNLFHLMNVEWTLGHSQRDSAQPLRDYKSTVAGVSIGIAI